VIDYLKDVYHRMRVYSHHVWKKETISISYILLTNWNASFWFLGKQDRESNYNILMVTALTRSCCHLPLLL